MSSDGTNLVSAPSWLPLRRGGRTTLSSPNRRDPPIAQEVAMPSSIVVPGSHARAVRVDAGHNVRVVNTHGTQVVDFWALRADAPEIAMSMQHSRIRWRNLRPHPSDEMLDEERATILT